MQAMPVNSRYAWFLGGKAESVVFEIISDATHRENRGCDALDVVVPEGSWGLGCMPHTTSASMLSYARVVGTGTREATEKRAWAAISRHPAARSSCGAMSVIPGELQRMGTASVCKYGRLAE